MVSQERIIPGELPVVVKHLGKPAGTGSPEHHREVLAEMLVQSAGR